MNTDNEPEKETETGASNDQEDYGSSFMTAGSGDESNSSNTEETENYERTQEQSLIDKVPKELFVRNRPSTIIKDKLRSGRTSHRANLSTIEAVDDPK